MNQPLIYYGNPILRQKCTEVTAITDDIRAFIQDLHDTMLETNGIGISAPQLGRSLAIFFTRYPIEDEKGQYTTAPVKLYINPKLSKPSSETWCHEEGCLSIPKVYAEVERPVRITITAQDIDGNEFTEELTGWAARVAMHENDHLNGVLFIDRISKKKRNEIEAKLRQLKKEHT